MREPFRKKGNLHRSARAGKGTSFTRAYQSERRLSARLEAVPFPLGADAEAIVPALAQTLHMRAHTPNQSLNPVAFTAKLFAIDLHRGLVIG